MAKFDQRGQTVTYQYNADVINLTNVANRADFARQIENMASEVARATNLNAIDAIQGQEAQNALTEAASEAQKTHPNKITIASALETAGSIVKGATALGGLYMATVKALEVAHRLF
jgi:hypothetical protein